jgi:thioredoxin-like negative regulator of GroEL
MAIINLTKETFKQQISEVDKPVIVDFWAHGVRIVEESHQLLIRLQVSRRTSLFLLN